MKKIDSKTKSKIEYISNIAMYAAFVVYVTAMMIRETVLIHVMDLLSANNIEIIKSICLYIFFFKIFFDTVNGEKLQLITILLYIVTLVIYKTTNNDRLMFLFTLIVASRKCDIKEMIEMILIIDSVFFIFMIFLSLNGMIPDWIFFRGDGGIRHSLGYVYPGVTMGYYLVIISMYCYVRNSKATYIELIVLQVINYYIYTLTDTRATFILSTIVILGMMVYKISKKLLQNEKVKTLFNRKSIKKILKIALCSIPLIFLILTILLTYLYSIGNDVGIYLNKLLSNRLALNWKALNRYPINLFGTKINWRRLGRIWICKSNTNRIL